LNSRSSFHTSVRINTTSPTNARTIAVARDTIAMAVERVAVILSEPSRTSTSSPVRAHLDTRICASSTTSDTPRTQAEPGSTGPVRLNDDVVEQPGGHLVYDATLSPSQLHFVVRPAAHVCSHCPGPREDGFVLRMGDGGARYLAADNVWMT
jgi:hypothetical protein